MLKNFIVIILLILAVIAVYSWVSQHHSVLPASTSTLNTSLSPSSSVASSPLSNTPVGSPAATQIFYPMTKYTSRITNRWYGKYITAADAVGLPCGDPFVGYHTGDDLEVEAAELQPVVPVYAIADGTVRQVGLVSGYGGLIVIEHLLAGQAVTAYYGHIDLNRTTIKLGDPVKAGQQISALGDACSDQTSDERKHLHFSIHKGSDIDVKGYVDTQSELAAWLNPKETLTQLKAQTPTL